MLANAATPPATAQAATGGTGYAASIVCDSFLHTMHVDVAASAAAGVNSQNIAARLAIWDRVAGKSLPNTQWFGFTHTLKTTVSNGVGGTTVVTTPFEVYGITFSSPSLPSGYYQIYTQYAWLDAPTGTWSYSNWIYTSSYKQYGEYLLRDRCVTA